MNDGEGWTVDEIIDFASVPLRVVGWGFLPLPGEGKRRQRALDEARALLRQVAEIEERSPDPAEDGDEQQ